MAEEIYIDDDGYERFVYTDALVHRHIAYHLIYLPNREKYPLNFSEYIVHHKNWNKRNNDDSNLAILTEEEHNRIHGTSVFHEERDLDDDLLF